MRSQSWHGCAISFEDLDAWQLADELKREVYRLTATGPAPRTSNSAARFGSPLRRLPETSAEGFGRFRPRPFAQFMDFSIASTDGNPGLHSAMAFYRGALHRRHDPPGQGSDGSLSASIHKSFSWYLKSLQRDELPIPSNAERTKNVERRTKNEERRTIIIFLRIFERRVSPRRAHDAPARMRGRSAHPQVADRRRVPAPSPGAGRRKNSCSSVSSPWKMLPSRQAELAFEVERRHDLPVQDDVADVRRELGDRVDRRRRRTPRAARPTCRLPAHTARIARSRTGCACLAAPPTDR